MTPALLANHWPGWAFLLIFGAFAAFLGILIYLEKRIQTDVERKN